MMSGLVPIEVQNNPKFKLRCLVEKMKHELPGVDCFIRERCDQYPRFIEIVFEAPPYKLFECYKRKMFSFMISWEELQHFEIGVLFSNWANSHQMIDLLKYSNKIMVENITKHIIKYEPIECEVAPEEKVPVDVWIWAGFIVTFVWFWLQ